MNILLVGQDSGLLRQIADSEELRAHSVEDLLWANTLADAYAILSTREISLIFADTDLPDGSGLDVLSRLREARRRITVVLWSREMDFSAVRQAMRLMAYDFVVGELSGPEVADLIRAAMKGVEMTHRIDIFYQSVSDIRQQNRIGFWTELLLSPEPEGPRVKPLHLVGHYQDYNADSRFYLCILSLADGSETPPTWKEYALRNVFSELFSEHGFETEAVFPVTDGDTCCVLRAAKDATPALLHSLLSELVPFVRRELAGWVNCYYSDEVSLDTARKAYAKLVRCYEDDVASYGTVIRAETFTAPEVRYSLPQMAEWEMLVIYRRADELVFLIKTHLDRLVSRNAVSRPYLKSLRIEMMQMLQSVLKAHSIGAYDIYADQRFDLLRQNSLRSVEHMKRYLEYIVRAGVGYLDAVNETQSVVGRVKDYVDHHFNEDISRNSIARTVFLNPDYLARVFKRETGMSLGAYVKDRRILEAKKLLAETDVQVNEIAIRVGYDNSSYFSHIFHQCTGLSPNEFRRQNMKKKTR